MTEAGEVTRLLLAHRDGDRDALDRLIPLIYDDLHRIAHIHSTRRPNDRSLDTTSLVHEAYLRFARVDGGRYDDRGHFFSVCARVMRQIVISRARRRAAAKRGGDVEIVPWVDDLPAATEQAEHLLDLDRALDRLSVHDARLARIVECRYFAGFTEDDTAQAVGVSSRTVQRDWLRARAWLREELGDREGKPS